MTNKTKAIIGIVGGVVVLGSVGAAMGGNDDNGISSSSSSSSIVSTVSSEQSSTVSEISTGSDVEQEYKILTGDILDVTENEDTLVIKVKINSLASDDKTINQNFHNAEKIILSGGDKFKEIQYWAVADTRDGSENKVISFTVPEDVIKGVADRNIVATQLPDLVTDLWILPSLRQNDDTSTISSEQTAMTEPPQSSTETTPQSSEPPVETPSTTTSENHFNDYSNPEQQNTTEYVLNTKTLKIHFPSCNDVKKISEENYATTTDFDKAISEGYTACGHCNPF